MKRNWLKRKKGLSSKGKSDTARAKDEIQKLLRALAIKNQKECWVKLQGITEFGECDEVQQYDHLETRAKNISYADPRLGVLVCKRHHFYHGSPRREQVEQYENLVREFIGPERAKLWERVRKDTKSYPKLLWDWQKDIMFLKAELTKSGDNS